MQSADIGLIGLAVMGQNLVLNMADHGYKVAVYNRTTAVVDNFVNQAANQQNLIGARSIKAFCESLKKPRKVMLMVKAGPVVDQFIDQLIPLLDAGDVIIDGGNSLYTDTERRTHSCLDKGILYLGMGVSGGEEGARHGPSIMPGGNKEAWLQTQTIFQSIAAKADGEPCCQWVGEGGAGHYVKMVHNGIEYGDMQLICEAYHLLREGMGLSIEEISDVFGVWNEAELDSYLIEITRNILRARETDGTLILDKILDTAGQKGTGKWTGINALELGMPLTLIGEAVFARCLSALKSERLNAAQILRGPTTSFTGDKQVYIEAVRNALYASKIVSYAQGFMLMREAAAEYKWNLNYGDIALMWRGGCIIRSRFLGNIKQAFMQHENLESLLLHEFFTNAIHDAQQGWRKAIQLAIELGIPTPAFSSALAFYDGYRSGSLPANLLQAQRDYFGAHTYERVDKPRGEFFHTQWSSAIR